MHNRVLFVERSGELRLLARLSTAGAEPKGNQVLRGREVSKSRPETGHAADRGGGDLYRVPVAAGGAGVAHGTPLCGTEALR